MSKFIKKRPSELVRLRVVQKALSVLELPKKEEYTRELVMDKFRLLVKAAHPDTGAISLKDLNSLRIAKDILIANLEDDNA